MTENKLTNEGELSLELIRNNKEKSENLQSILNRKIRRQICRQRFVPRTLNLFSIAQLLMTSYFVNRIFKTPHHLNTNLKSIMSLFISLLPYRRDI